MPSGFPFRRQRRQSGSPARDALNLLASGAATLDQAEAANAATDFDRQQQSPFADPGYGIGLAGHGTMDIRTRARRDRRSSVKGRWSLEPKSDKVSDNGSRLRPTQRDVPRR